MQSHIVWSNERNHLLEVWNISCRTWFLWSLWDVFLGGLNGIFNQHQIQQKHAAIGLSVGSRYCTTITKVFWFALALHVAESQGCWFSQTCWGLYKQQQAWRVSYKIVCSYFWVGGMGFLLKEQYVHVSFSCIYMIWYTIYIYMHNHIMVHIYIYIHIYIHTSRSHKKSHPPLRGATWTLRG